jgi:hypothetical protein
VTKPDREAARASELALESTSAQASKEARYANSAHLYLAQAPLRPSCGARPRDEAYYFPVGTLGPLRGTFDEDSFRRGVYTPLLLAMNEPSLSCAPVPGATYRFLWVRTLGRPLAVRFDAAPGEVVLEILELGGAGGYVFPRDVVRKSTRRLTPGSSMELRAALEAADVWTMPSWSARGGQNGARWIVEARRGATYHVVDRWSPQPACPARADQSSIRR